MATILVMNGRNEGEWYTIPQAKPLVVGRDDTLIAELLDVCVSRRHLEVRYDAKDGCYYAVDLQSRNGVMVNGEKVRAFRALLEGDVIQIGHTLLIFTLRDFDDNRHAQAFLKEAQKQHQAMIEAVAQHEQEVLEKDVSSLLGFDLRRFFRQR